MSYFLNRYNLTPEQYEVFRNKVITGHFPEVVKEFRNHTGFTLAESNRIIDREFRVEHKLSLDFMVYECIQKIKKCDELNNMPIASDIGTVLDFAENQLYLGLNSSILKQS